jgi:hypothetical protein
MNTFSSSVEPSLTHSILSLVITFHECLKVTVRISGFLRGIQKVVVNTVYLSQLLPQIYGLPYLIKKCLVTIQIQNHKNGFRILTPNYIQIV